MKYGRKRRSFRPKSEAMNYKTRGRAPWTWLGPQPSPPPTQGNTTQNNAGIIRLETGFEIAILVFERCNKLDGYITF
jgi:hypothetical protein